MSCPALSDWTQAETWQTIFHFGHLFYGNIHVQEVEEGAMMSAELQLAAKQRHVMSIAYGPGKALLTTGFMLWMSGSSVQIFSIMMTGMALINPLKALVAINDTFRGFEKEEGVDLKIPKLIFIALQILSLAVAVYKCSTMGLLPLTSADWVSYLPPVKYAEAAAAPM